MVNGNRSLENPYEALANLYPGGGKMQGYITSSGDLYLMRYLMAQRMKNPNLQWEKTQSWNFAFGLWIFERPYYRYVGILSNEYQRYDYETTSI